MRIESKEAAEELLAIAVSREEQDNGLLNSNTAQI